MSNRIQMESILQRITMVTRDSFRDKEFSVVAEKITINQHDFTVQLALTKTQIKPNTNVISKVIQKSLECKGVKILSHKIGGKFIDIIIPHSLKLTQRDNLENVNLSDWNKQ